MVTTSISVNAMMALPCATLSSKKRAIKSAVPVLCMAPATGINAASKIITGQSMASYTALSGTVRKAMLANTPMAKETAAGSNPKAALPTANNMMALASHALRLLGMRKSRSASGTQPESTPNSARASAWPCSSNKSPAWTVIVLSRLFEREPSRETANRFSPYRLRNRMSWAERPAMTLAGNTANSISTMSCWARALSSFSSLFFSSSLS